LKLIFSLAFKFEMKKKIFLINKNFKEPKSINRKKTMLNLKIRFGHEKKGKSREEEESRWS
jgi:hypothetical protein